MPDISISTLAASSALNLLVDSCVSGDSSSGQLAEWGGKTHRVMVLENGFAWAGQNYRSLSEVATRISGTRWSGPRFFGLKQGDHR
jgi:hypothetical protein